jgi:hypothetical protein
VRALHRTARVAGFLSRSMDACIDPVMTDSVGSDATAQHFNGPAERIPRSREPSASEMRDGQIVEHFHSILPPARTVMELESPVQFSR